MLSAVTNKAFTGAMVQTRDQQAGDHSHIDICSDALRGVTAKGDAVGTTTYSGSVLKNAAPELGPGCNASASRGVHADGRMQRSRLVVVHPLLALALMMMISSERAEDMTIPRNASTLQLSTPPHAGTSTDPTGGLMEDQPYLSTNNTGGGAASMTFSTCFSAHPSEAAQTRVHCITSVAAACARGAPGQ